ncbi:MAG: hypothetical protein HN729_00370 [Candidatus Marinimicrobia bacterium]|jgi:hypothetical protein|nr:hypothetical protein [Candidatus Neomarinimicrobiota bacterium]MBT3758416.1 hypothetical protein [Candidatus Neomarinimicrobiota bacterium]MBT3894930.1 hypothetical protein [Candidatus Neomarinimicrobiota bacterium]MBT4850621.1 hypothetical protein [Candidatus Neomarinimicrobiota bacterium]MBT5537658.1 hypothetical protein [Candidatus Neomarinimicrobiota bacterium]
MNEEIINIESNISFLPGIHETAWTFIGCTIKIKVEKKEKILEHFKAIRK